MRGRTTDWLGKHHLFGSCSPGCATCRRACRFFKEFHAAQDEANSCVLDLDDEYVRGLLRRTAVATREMDWEVR